MLYIYTIAFYFINQIDMCLHIVKYNSTIILIIIKLKNLWIMITKNLNKNCIVAKFMLRILSGKKIKK